MRSFIGFIVFLSVTMGVFAGVITPIDVFLVEGEQRYVAREELSNFRETMSRAGKKITEVEIYDVEGEERLLISVERRDDFLKAVREHGIRFERRIVFFENGKVKELPQSEMRDMPAVRKNDMCDVGAGSKNRLPEQSGIEGLLAAALLGLAVWILMCRDKRQKQKRNTVEKKN